MVIALKIKLKRDGSLTKATMNRLLKIVHIRTGKFWHRFILPKHFTTPAKREYGYAPRAPTRVRVTVKGTTFTQRGYETKKFFQVGHRRPLEWSGTLKRQVLSKGKIRAVKPRGGSIKTIVTVTGPRWMHGGAGQPDKVAEMKAISQADARKMTEFMSKTMVRELNNIKKRFNPG